MSLGRGYTTPRDTIDVAISSSTVVAVSTWRSPIVVTSTATHSTDPHGTVAAHPSNLGVEQAAMAKSSPFFFLPLHWIPAQPISAVRKTRIVLGSGTLEPPPPGGTGGPAGLEP